MSCCSEADLEKCFKDHAGPDGTLSRAELRKMVEEKWGCKVQRGKCPEAMDRELFDCMDKDDDGQVTWEEFKDFAEKMKKCKEMMEQGRGQGQGQGQGRRCNM